MSLPIPPEFKAAKPFLQRAEELDRDPSQEASVTAYYCRQRAMELGIALRDTAQDPAAATTFLLSLMDTLEAKKQALGDLNREEGEQVVCQFAEDVFGKADAEDRSGRASKATARTFYAASIFFDALTQFGERGEEVEIQGHGHHEVFAGGSKTGARAARLGAYHSGHPGRYCIAAAFTAAALFRSAAGGQALGAVAAPGAGLAAAGAARFRAAPYPGLGAAAAAAASFIYGAAAFPFAVRGRY